MFTHDLLRKKKKKSKEPSISCRQDKKQTELLVSVRTQVLASLPASQFKKKKKKHSTFPSVAYYHLPPLQKRWDSNIGLSSELPALSFKRDLEARIKALAPGLCPQGSWQRNLTAPQRLALGQGVPPAPQRWKISLLSPPFPARHKSKPTVVLTPHLIKMRAHGLDTKEGLSHQKCHICYFA